MSLLQMLAIGWLVICLAYNALAMEAFLKTIPGVARTATAHAYCGVFASAVIMLNPWMFPPASLFIQCLAAALWIVHSLAFLRGVRRLMTGAAS